MISVLLFAVLVSASVLLTRSMMSGQRNSLLPLVGGAGAGASLGFFAGVLLPIPRDTFLSLIVACAVGGLAGAISARK